MLNDQTVRKLLVEGWVFHWDKSTWHVGATHERRGNLSVCEIKPSPHFDHDEVGSALARMLNNFIGEPPS